MDLCTITAASVSTSSSEETKCAVYQSPIALSEVTSTLAKRDQRDDNQHEDCKSSCPSDRATDKVILYTFDPLTKNFNVLNKVKLTNNEETYKMVEFHFHEKAEHTINSKQHALELHLVFQSPALPATSTSKSSSSSNAGSVNAIYVIGVIAQLGKRTSRIFKRIISGEPFRIPTPSTNPHFSYPGSLTTPPFTKSVSWNVLSDIETITVKDLEHLKSMSKGDRKLQLRDGRDIIFSSISAAKMLPTLPCCK